MVFYTNLFRNLDSIKQQHAIISTYDGDKKEPWVSPLDIAATISNEVEQPFNGHSVHYLASDFISPNEIIQIIGEAIGDPKLKWIKISPEQMLEGMLKAGMNEWIANGFLQMQAAQEDASLYTDFIAMNPCLVTTNLKNLQKSLHRYIIKITNNMKKALITGANKGIGFETTRNFYNRTIMCF